MKAILVMAISSVYNPPINIFVVQLRLCFLIDKGLEIILKIDSMLKHYYYFILV